MDGRILLNRWMVGSAFVLLACSGSPSSSPQGSGGGGGDGSGGTTATAGMGGSSAGSSGSGSGGLAGGGSVSGGSSGATSSSGAGGSSGSTAGQGGSAGSAGSIGCGSMSSLQSGRYTIDVGGTTREYELAVPDDYNPDEPYTLIFGWHWRGANAQAIVDNDYYGLKPLANGSAIFVSPEGLVDDGVTGWANPGGRDIDFALATVEHLKSELCIDESRIFSTGFSYGGMMSFAVGCALGDVFRAIAPFAGSLWSGCEEGAAPVAMWGSHGYSGGADGVVPIAAGRDGRDEFLARNGCADETLPVEPDECVTYQGCQEGYPVTWCEWDGGHWWPSFASQAVWDFFSQF